MKGEPVWLTRVIDRLEAAMFPHQESEEEAESLTDVGRDRIGGVLRVLDEAAFNDGFDAAIHAVLPPEALKTIKFRHPKYLRDRKDEYDKVRLQS